MPVYQVAPEYRDDIKKCADCGLRLIDHKPDGSEIFPVEQGASDRLSPLLSLFLRERVPPHSARAHRCPARARSGLHPPAGMM